MSQQTLPCTPPPPQTIKGGFIFSHRCLVPPIFFPKEKMDFVGDIRIRTHKNVVLRHNHSNLISIRLALFDIIYRVTYYSTGFIETKKLQ